MEPKGMERNEKDDKQNDKEVKLDYSQIDDVNLLIKKLADSADHIRKNLSLKDKVILQNFDEKMEVEILKFVTRLKEISDNDKNFLQKWFTNRK